MINKFNGQFNKAYANVSIKIQSDGSSDPIVDSWWDQFVVIEDFLIQGRLRVPENSNDDVFQKDLLRFSLDGSKVFGNGHTIGFVKMFMKSFVSNMDFEPKLPLLKVTTIDFASSLISILKKYIFHRDHTELKM